MGAIRISLLYRQAFSCVVTGPRAVIFSDSFNKYGFIRFLQPDKWARHSKCSSSVMTSSDMRDSNDRRLEKDKDGDAEYEKSRLSNDETPECGEIRNTSIVSKEGNVVNASGHEDQLKRQYGLWSICGLALTIDNAWIAFGGTLTVSILNGGSPGVLYEFITACVYYAFIGASIAELASAIASSGGVYHWASITPGARYGRIVGFFTGSLNFFGWIFDLASIVYIPSNVVVQM